MLRTKKHVRMTGQDFHRFMRVILAGDRQHDSAVAQIEQSALNLTIDAARIFGADLDSGRSLLSENSTPQCVVEVHDDRLGNASGDRMKKTHPLVAEIDQVTESQVRRPRGPHPADRSVH